MTGRAESRQGRLLVVGTPIGNLGDLSPRAGGGVSPCRCDLLRRYTCHLEVTCAPRRGAPAHTLRRERHRFACARFGGANARRRRARLRLRCRHAGRLRPRTGARGRRPATRGHGRSRLCPVPSPASTALVASGMPCEHFFFEGFLPRKEPASATRRLAPARNACPGRCSSTSPPTASAATLASRSREVLPAREAALCRELTQAPRGGSLRGPGARIASPSWLHARGQLKGEIV